MYSLKRRNGVPAATPPQSILAAKRRRQLYPFFFAMGPIALSITSVLLIGLMAVLYLSQVGQAVAENQKLQDTRTQQTLVERQNQDLAYALSQEQSPTYIAEHAKELGLVPADPKTVQVFVVKNLKPLPIHREDVDP
jgi:cell division protein FtsL